MILKTEIPKLDELLNGGLREGSSTLIVSSPGIRNVQFLQNIVYNRLKGNDKVAYVTLNKRPVLVKRMFQEYDWDVSKFEKMKKLMIIDMYQKIIGKSSLGEVQRFVISEIQKLKSNTLLIIDSVSSFLDVYGANKKTVNAIGEWIKTSKNLTVVGLFTGWPYKKKIAADIRSQFGCVIDLKSVERNIILRNYFTVSKANWIKKLKKEDVMFDVISPGGVKEYIPKILVTGPYNSGKSTFTHAVSTKATSVDRLGTTIALDYGHVTYKGYAADVFGTPGQTRFDPLLKMLGHRAIGLFLVLDSTKPESFARAEEMISECRASKLPYVVIANKQDLKNALSVNQIRKRMSLSKLVKIVPCVSTKKRGLSRALDILFKEIGG